MTSEISRVGSEQVDGTEFDFREARSIGTTTLDNAFADLERGPDGRARVTLHDPDAGRTVTLSVDEHYGYLMLFTGDPLADVNRRALAAEPDDLPSERLPHRGLRHPPRSGRLGHRCLGDRSPLRYAGELDRCRARADRRRSDALTDHADVLRTGAGAR